MSEHTVKIDTLLADLCVYFVSKYSLSPRDAVGIVMRSEVAEEIRNEGSSLHDVPLEQLAAMIL